MLLTPQEIHLVAPCQFLPRVWVGVTRNRFKGGVYIGMGVVPQEPLVQLPMGDFSVEEVGRQPPFTPDDWDEQSPLEGWVKTYKDCVLWWLKQEGLIQLHCAPVTNCSTVHFRLCLSGAVLENRPSCDQEEYLQQIFAHLVPAGAK